MTIADDFYYNGAHGYEYNVKLMLWDKKTSNDDKSTGIDYDVLSGLPGASSSLLDYGVKINDPIIIQGTLAKCPCYNNDDEHFYTLREQRYILTWLTSDKNLHWLEFIDKETEYVAYLCRVTSVKKKMFMGKVIGFDVTWTTNSVFAYSKEITEHYSSATSLSIPDWYCDSDDSDYLYPKMEVTVRSSEIQIEIENDYESRRSTLHNLTSGDVIQLDSVNRMITSKLDKNFKDDFNWYFPRFAPRCYSTINITGDCDITMKYRLPRRVGEY